MRHEEVVERLPWYLAGSLGEEERGAVEEHLEQCAECRREREATRVAARLFDAEHPAAAELVAVAWDRATAEEAQAIREHARSCAECREELELLERSRELEAAEGVESRLLAFQRRPRNRPVPGWWVALAAALGLVAAGFALAFFQRAESLRAQRDELAVRLEAAGAGQAELEVARRRSAAAEEQVAALDRELQRWRAPRTDVALVELLPSDVLRGAESAPSQVVSPRPGTELVLLLGLERPGEFGRYAVRLRGGDGAELWSAAGVAPDADGALELLVPAALLPAGTVLVEVSGEGERGARAVATYRLVVRSAAARP